ncbi:MAG: MFS transporter [Chitinophagaceae bacterium]|nr:MFS transporter [Chitinophagaceae bacterium]
MNFSKTHRTLLLASSLWFFGEGLFSPLFAVFSEKVGGDILDVTWALSLYLVLTGVLYIVFGRLLRRSNYKEIALIAGYLLNTLLTFCYILIHNSTQLLCLQVGLAVAEALSTPVWDALFAKNLDNSDDSLFWGIAGGHSQLVSGVAIALGGLVIYYFSFNTLFIIMGSIQAVATVIQTGLFFNRARKGPS